MGCLGRPRLCRVCEWFHRLTEEESELSPPIRGGGGERERERERDHSCGHVACENNYYYRMVYFELPIVMY